MELRINRVRINHSPPVVEILEVEEGERDMNIPPSEQQLQEQRNINPPYPQRNIIPPSQQQQQQEEEGIIKLYFLVNILLDLLLEFFFKMHKNGNNANIVSRAFTT